MAFGLTAVPDITSAATIDFVWSGLAGFDYATLDYGDGHVTKIFPPGGQVTHTYKVPGTFTATAKDPSSNVLTTATVTVPGTATAPAAAPTSMSGPLQINATGNASPSTLPLGFTDAKDTGLDLVGSFAGGEGVPGTDTDSTARLNAWVYQKNQGSVSGQQGQYGEFVRGYAMKVNAHPTIAFYGPVGGYTTRTAPNVGGDPIGSTWQPIGWLGAQYADIDGVTQFKHMALEIPDKSNGFMIGRLIFPFGNLTPGAQMSDIGLDSTNIHTNAANLVIGAGSGRLGICGAPNNQRTLEFNSDGTTALFRAQYTRWKVMASNEAEGGANAGSNFNIEAFDDNGNSLSPTFGGKPFIVMRATGNSIFGANGALAQPGQISVQSPAAKHGVYVQPSATPGAGWAAFSAQMTGNADIVVGAKLAGDTNFRWAVGTDGKQFWGPGNAGSDAILYRSAVGTLKTDTAFSIGGNVGFYGTAPAAKQTVTGSKGANAALTSLMAALVALGLVTDTTT